jgi:hypothetical protein
MSLLYRIIPIGKAPVAKATLIKSGKRGILENAKADDL